MGDWERVSWIYSVGPMKIARARVKSSDYTIVSCRFLHYNSLLCSRRNGTVIGKFPDVCVARQPNSQINNEEDVHHLSTLFLISVINIVYIYYETALCSIILRIVVIHSLHPAVVTLLQIPKENHLRRSSPVSCFLSR